MWRSALVAASAAVAIVIAPAAPLHAEGTDAELDELDPSASRAPRLRVTRGFVATETRSYLSQRDAVGNEEQLLGELRFGVDLRLSNHASGYVRPWLLIDALDPALLRYEPLDAYVAYKRASWDLKLGQFVEAWGMADTYNPIDVLNRRDPAPDFFRPVALGELGARVRVATRLGRTIEELAVSVYAMPLWRPTPFPTVNSRFGLSADIATIRRDLTQRPAFADAMFGAVRIDHTLRMGFANADLQYVVARGPDRTPVFTFVPLMDGTLDLVPQYHGSWIFGAGARVVPNAAGWSRFAFRGELAHRRPYELPSVAAIVAEPYTQLAAGVERTFNGVIARTDALTAIVEYLADVGASDQPSELRPFDSDVAIALRWTANDFGRTAIDTRLVIDVTSAELIAELAIARQLRFVHRDLRLELRGRLMRRSNNEASVFALLPNNSGVALRLQLDF